MTCRYAAALEEARAIDRVLKSDNIPQQYSVENAPLLGIPFTAKEAFAVTGSLLYLLLHCINRY